MRVGSERKAIDLCGDDVVLLLVEGHRPRFQGHSVQQPQDHQWSSCNRSGRFQNAIVIVKRFDDCLVKGLAAVVQRMQHFSSAYAPQSGCSERANNGCRALLDAKTAEVPSEEAVVVAGDLNGHAGAAEYG